MRQEEAPMRLRSPSKALVRRTLTAFVLGVGLSCTWAADPRANASNAIDDPGAIRVLLAAQLDTTLSSQMNGTLGELQAALGQKVAKNALLAQFICTETQARAKV